VTDTRRMIEHHAERRDAECEVASLVILV